jgi:uncharacterized protein (UPF0335 family)
MITRDGLLTLIDEIDAAEREIGAARAGLREIYDRAKGGGFSVKAVRRLVAERRFGRDEAAEDALASYRQLLGPTPLELAASEPAPAGPPRTPPLPLPDADEEGDADELGEGEDEDDPADEDDADDDEADENPLPDPSPDPAPGPLAAKGRPVRKLKPVKDRKARGRRPVREAIAVQAP